MGASATPTAAAEACAPLAWQPLTFGGVAAFARAGWGRLLLVQGLIAGSVALSLVWLAASAWFPALAEAIRQLPASGEIRGGILEWPAASPARLAQNKFLSIVVDLDHAAPLDHTADLHLEFSRAEARLHSLLGYWSCRYPRGWVIGFNRPALEPWWGAWQSMVLAALAVGVVLGLLLSWAVAAFVYSLPLWLLACCLGREASGAGRWRVAAMVQMPGALWLTAALVLYAHHQIGVVQLCAAWLAHWLIGWVYLLGAAFRLPKLTAASPSIVNPFVARGDPKLPRAKGNS